MIDFSRVTRDYFGDFDDPCVINSGWCFVWAWLAYLAEPGARIHSYARYPGGGADAHAWVSFGGLHYDAEAPLGAGSPVCLPYFARCGYRPLRRKCHGAGEPWPWCTEYEFRRCWEGDPIRRARWPEVAAMLDGRWTSQGLMLWPRVLPFPTFRKRWP